MTKKQSSKKRTPQFRKFGVVLQHVKGNINNNKEVLARVEALHKEGKIKEYAYILHDKDTYTEEEVLSWKGVGKAPKVGAPKKDHYHIGFSVNGDAISFKATAELIGVPTEAVEQISSKHFVGYMAYLTHESAPTKHQYGRDEVVTSLSEEVWGRDVDRYVARKEAKEAKLDCEMVVRAILRGEIKKYHLIDETREDLHMVYSLNQSKINGALKVASEIKLAKQATGGREMEALFIQGESGTGKTTAARYFATKLGKEAYISSSENDPLDGYGGQEYLVMDDLRGKSMDFAEFLKLSDNNTGSSYRSRYYNKVVDAEALVITSTKSLAQFANDLRNSDGESMKQVYRRIKTVIIVTEERYDFYEYNASYQQGEGDLVQSYECKEVNESGALVTVTKEARLPYRHLGRTENEGLKEVRMRDQRSYASDLFGFVSKP